jgi:hypothetical protein
MGSLLIVPLHGSSFDITLSLAREIGPERIILCHRWRGSGEAHRNAIKLSEYLHEKLDDIALTEVSERKRGNIRKNTQVAVEALERYASMESLGIVFTNLITNQHEETGFDVHIVILDGMPMGYMIGAFYAGLKVPLTVWTGDIGRDIRSIHPNRYNPGDSKRHTLRRIPQLKEISDGLRWFNASPSSTITLLIAKNLDTSHNEGWFKTKEILDKDKRSLNQTAITNHVSRMVEKGYIERSQRPTTHYRLAELGHRMAELLGSKEGEEE